MGAQKYLDELDRDLIRVGVGKNLGFVRECGQELAKFPDDCFTLGHSARVKRSFVRAGALYDLDSRRLHLGGWLHDIGKIRNPELFAFEGRYNDKQKEGKRLHVQYTRKILENRFPFISRFTEHHHENQKDSYPGYSVDEVRKGDAQEVKLYSQLLEICDKFDAMMNRSDWNDLTKNERLENFMDFNWNDPVLVDNLLKKKVLKV